VDFTVTVDWHESHKFLKAEYAAPDSFYMMQVALNNLNSQI
jgi:hypothetical protein